MTDRLRIEVYRKAEQKFCGDFGGTVLIGRQANPAEPLFFSHLGEGGATRLAIAAGDQSTISRLHLRLEPRSGDRVRADNRGKNVIQVVDNPPLAPGDNCEVDLPAIFVMGEMAVRVKPFTPRVDHGEFLSLDQPTMIPNRSADVLIAGAPTRLTATLVNDSAKSLASAEMPRPSAAIAAFSLDASEGAIGWLQTFIDVLQSAVNSSDFFARSAAAIVNLVGLDTGCALLAQNDQWEIVAKVSAPHIADQPPFRPSNRILKRMKQEKRTFWQRPSSATDSGTPRASSSMNSLAEVEAVVVAPLMNAAGQVIGAMYGERRTGSEHGPDPSISRLDAMIVETLACGVAAGLARQEEQKKAMAARVRFEQFFTPELTRQLELEPDLLNGREADVSILFCDIRGFSRISHKIGPTRTLDFIHDVMNELSEIVVRCQGVLVDYIGDELMAMWGAPQAQPDHADLACQAAIEMIRVIPRINARWQAEIAEPFDLGIGVNSGRARVGNTGSDRKFKYGPLGSTVNLASRVQGSTKYLCSQIIITSATQQRLNQPLTLRRLCHVRVVNIPDAVELFELRACTDDAWSSICQRYHRCLEHFEQQQFHRAVALLGEILTDHHDDGPSLLLLSRSVNQLVQADPKFDVAWTLPGK